MLHYILFYTIKNHCYFESKYMVIKIHHTMDVKTVFIWKIVYRYYNIYLSESYFQFPF